MSGKLDRRVQLLRPKTVENDYNEEQIVFEPAYDNFPAHRTEEVTADKEDLKGKLESGSNVTEWIIRFIPALGIKSTWRIKDLHDGQTYKIISPPTEIGRRQGIRIKAELIQ